MSTPRIVTALERVGTTKDAVNAQPRITEQLSTLKQLLIKHAPEDAAFQGPYYYLHCSDAPEARAILDKYYSVPKTIRKLLPIEAFCTAAGVSTLKALEVIYGTAARIAQQGTVVAQALASAKSPDVVEMSMGFANDPMGFKDREMLAKISGLIQQPKGTNIKITQNANASATAVAASAAPPPEQTIRRMVDRWNDRNPPALVVEGVVEDDDDVSQSNVIDQ